MILWGRDAKHLQGNFRCSIWVLIAQRSDVYEEIAKSGGESPAVLRSVRQWIFIEALWKKGQNQRFLAHFHGVPMETHRIENRRTRGNSAQNYVSFPQTSFAVWSMLKYLIAREVLMVYVSEVCPIVSLYGTLLLSTFSVVCSLVCSLLSSGAFGKQEKGCPTLTAGHCRLCERLLVGDMIMVI